MIEFPLLQPLVSGLDPRKPLFLFVTYGGGHVNMVIPIARKLINSGAANVLVLGMTTAAPKLAAASISHFGFRHLLTPSDQAAIEWGNKLVTDVNNAQVSAEESIAYLGLNYQELHRSLGAERAAETYQLLGRHAFSPVGLMARLIQFLNPTAVIATNSPRAERAAIFAASRLGIPSLCLVDLFAIRQVDWIAQPDFATRVCVLADSVKQFFAAAGRPPEHIVVTGNPAFDTLANPDLIRKGAELRDHNGWGNRFTILWASQPEPARHPFDASIIGDPRLPVQIEQEIFRIASRHPEWQLVVRLHPSETRTVTALPPNAQLSTQADPLHPLLAAVHAVILTTSTVGVEAACLDKQVLTYERSILSQDSPYSRLGLSRGVMSEQDLENALREIALSICSSATLDSMITASNVDTHGLASNGRRTASQDLHVGSAVDRIIDELYFITGSSKNRFGYNEQRPAA